MVLLCFYHLKLPSKYSTASPSYIQSISKVWTIQAPEILDNIQSYQKPTIFRFQVLWGCLPLTITVPISRLYLSGNCCVNHLASRPTITWNWKRKFPTFWSFISDHSPQENNAAWYFNFIGSLLLYHLLIQHRLTISFLKFRSVLKKFQARMSKQ